MTHRMIKYTYGTSVMTPFIPFLPGHAKRSDKVCMGIKGPMLDDHFSVILRKVRVTTRRPVDDARPFPFVSGIDGQRQRGVLGVVQTEYPQREREVLAPILRGYPVLFGI